MREQEEDNEATAIPEFVFEFSVGGIIVNLTSYVIIYLHRLLLFLFLRWTRFKLITLQL